MLQCDLTNSSYVTLETTSELQLQQQRDSRVHLHGLKRVAMAVLKVSASYNY